MNFQTMYNEKLTSAEDAVKVVNSGDWVDYGWCTGLGCCYGKTSSGID